MLLIDKLIHGFHWYIQQPGQPTRPVAVNLLGGRLTEVIDCLNELSYNTKGNPELIEVDRQWRENLEKARKMLSLDLPRES